MPLQTGDTRKGKCAPAHGRCSGRERSVPPTQERVREKVCPGTQEMLRERRVPCIQDILGMWQLDLSELKC